MPASVTRIGSTVCFTLDGNMIDAARMAQETGVGMRLVQRALRANVMPYRCHDCVEAETEYDSAPEDSQRAYAALQAIALFDYVTCDRNTATVPYFE